jgi:hypothetical protein
MAYPKKLPLKEVFARVDTHHPDIPFFSISQLTVGDCMVTGSSSIGTTTPHSNKAKGQMSRGITNLGKTLFGARLVERRSLTNILCTRMQTPVFHKA